MFLLIINEKLNTFTYFKDDKVFKDSRSESDSEGSDSKVYLFLFKPDGSVTLNYDNKSTSQNYTSVSMYHENTDYSGGYSILREDTATREISVKFSLASNKCNCYCTWREAENHSYQNKEVNEELTLVEDLVNKRVRVSADILKYFYN